MRSSASRTSCAATRSRKNAGPPASVGFPDLQPRHGDPLGAEQAPLEGEVSTEAAQSPSGSHHAVAGHVRPVAGAHDVSNGACGAGPTGEPRHVAVGGNSAGRDPTDDRQHPSRETGRPLRRHDPLSMNHPTDDRPGRCQPRVWERLTFVPLPDHSAAKRPAGGCLDARWGRRKYARNLGKSEGPSNAETCPQPWRLVCTTVSVRIPMERPPQGALARSGGPPKRSRRTAPVRVSGTRSLSYAGLRGTRRDVA